MKIIIAEDEQPQREALAAALLEVWPEAHLVASCADGLEALEAFHREQPAAAFLDLRMPGLHGLEVARAMAGVTQVVFITAHDDAAVRAFEHGAVDYVLKPVRIERLQQAVNRLRERLRGASSVDLNQVVDRLRTQLAGAGRPQTLKWVTASIGEVTKLYSIDEVIAFHAQDKYTRVITANDEAIIRTSLRELLQMLDPDVFWQVHRSVIVRASAIEYVRRDELTKSSLRLRGRPEELPVSAAFQSRFRGM